MKQFENMERYLAEKGKTDQVRAIADSKDGQRLMEKLDANQVERVIQSGDSNAMRTLLLQVLQTGEGRRIAAQLERLMDEQ